MILDHGQRMWNERCRMLNAENESTDDEQYCVFLRQYKDDLLTQKDQVLHRFDYHLLQRQPFFSHIQTEQPWRCGIFEYKELLNVSLNNVKIDPQTIEKFIRRVKQVRQQRLLPV